MRGIRNMQRGAPNYDRMSAAWLQVRSRASKTQSMAQGTRPRSRGDSSFGAAVLAGYDISGVSSANGFAGSFRGGGCWEADGQSDDRSSSGRRQF